MQYLTELSAIILPTIATSLMFLFALVAVIANMDRKTRRDIQRGRYSGTSGTNNSSSASFTPSRIWYDGRIGKWCVRLLEANGKPSPGRPVLMHDTKEDLENFLDYLELRNQSLGNQS